MSIDVRLGPREAHARFRRRPDRRHVLSYRGSRGALQLLDQTWTLAQVVMMRPGLAPSARAHDLWGVRTVDENSINHQLLAALPESRRALTATRDPDSRVRTRQVDGVAGNHLTCSYGRWPRTPSGAPLISRPYHLAVLKGRENIVARCCAWALDRLKNSGEFDRLVEHLGSPRVVRALCVHADAGGGLVLLLVAGGTVWNRSLHRRVQARTGGRANGAAVSRSRRQRERHDLPDRSVRAVHVRQSVATHPRLRRGRELLSMCLLELMRPSVPRAMGFYEGGEDA
jgi:hypothetical protein